MSSFAFRTLCVAALLTLSTAASAQQKSNPSSASAAHGQGSMELHRIMKEGGDMPMPMSGDVDKDFAAMMSMHHQQGIRMADVQLKHGKDAALKALAQRIKDEQKKEIGELAPFKK
ncbi:DUF305 domain-containing protein [Lysobacter arvi]|uniref:DUF305 domain-containing protein n=1 Tax=Lysobacter arvi TaxID=3038776 RepID=A0ABU1CGZ3_9GAMM|nr:DUF305 domain-containing protein [Lysobacter arvi]MDR0184231.1 DUF305 domain-containing protein [Lysobacter arvi]